jgi:hypothetical protein
MLRRVPRSGSGERSQGLGRLQERAWRTVGRGGKSRLDILNCVSIMAYWDK